LNNPVKRLTLQPIATCWLRIRAVTILYLLCVQTALGHNLDYAVVDLKSASGHQLDIEVYCHLSALLLGVEQRHLTPDEREYFFGMSDEEVETRLLDSKTLIESELHIYGDGSLLDIEITGFPGLSEIFKDALMTAKNPNLSEPIRARVNLSPTLAELTVAPPQIFNLAVIEFTNNSGTTSLQAITMGAMSEPFRLGPGFAQSNASSNTDLISFLGVGISHVLPNGWDHVLFIIAMMLGHESWRFLVWLVTVFTLSHTLALVMSVLGLVTVSGQIVEPLIALFIAIVAMENIFRPKKHSWRIKSVAVLGLLHGLGFAGALQRMSLGADNLFIALLGFNLGVEIGQLIVVTAIVLVTIRFRTTPGYRSHFVIA